jgi:23S rRNA G2445 N2-methylase RlmL
MTQPGGIVPVFCRVTAGLEPIAWLDIQTSNVRSTSPRFYRRVIIFEVTGDITPLATLKSVDDVYVYVAHLEEIKRTRDELAAIGRYAVAMDFRSAANHVSQVRPLPTPLTFYVTVSRSGKHNFSAPEVESVFSDAVQQATDWIKVSDFREAAINIRVILDDTALFVGLSLMESPLHRRKYKQCHRPGSLKPPVAYILSRIAGCQSQDVIIDPMCGVGTIPIEARLASNSQAVYGSDLSPAAVQCARQNWQAALGKESPHLFQADVHDYPLGKQMAAKIITNLPWGRQVQSESVYDLYRGYLHMVLRTGCDNVICVVLTDRVTELMEVVYNLSNLALLWVRQVSLYGSYPVICVLGGPAWVGREENAFRHISPLGTGIDRLIDNEGIWQSYTPLQSTANFFVDSSII